jgi:hypothetical protein
MQANLIYRIQKLMETTTKNFPHSRIPREGELLRGSNWRGVVGLIIGFGIILRIIPYLHNRSLWLDEALLALNILQKPFAQLAGPLDYQQMAPVGFLFIEKFLILNFGESEYALRAFPLLAGILSLFLFYGVARRMLTRRGLVIGLGLFAISEPLLRYSSELKQYSSDVTIALSICLLGLICIEKESRFVFALFLFSITGAILVWLSHPAIFSLAGVGVALTLYCLNIRKWQHVAWLVLPAGFWLGSFALNYFMVHLDVSQNSKMVEAWSGSTAFMPLTPFSVESLMWYPKAFFSMFLYPGGLAFYGLAAFCFIIGWVSVFFEKRYACYVVTFPIFFTLLASGLHMYPFQGRLILFLVPVMMMVIGQGVDRIMTVTKPTGWFVGVSLCALLMVVPVQTAFSTLLNPGRIGQIEDTRHVMTYLRQHYREGDKVYLYHSSEPAFIYYAKRVGLEKVQYQGGVKSKNNWDLYIDELRGLRGNDRVWMLFSHVHKNHGVDEEKFFLHVLNGLGTQVESFKRTGASVYLYTLPADSVE